MKVILFALLSRFCTLSAIAIWACVLACPKSRARCRPKKSLIRYWRRQIDPAKNHEIQPPLQGAFQLRVVQPVPLTDYQALDQYQRIFNRRTVARSPQTMRQERRNGPPIHQRIDLCQNVVCTNPFRRFAQKKVPQNTLENLPKVYKLKPDQGIPSLCRGLLMRCMTKNSDSFGGI